jgi:hypothetical protein
MKIFKISAASAATTVLALRKIGDQLGKNRAIMQE